MSTSAIEAATEPIVLTFYKRLFLVGSPDSLTGTWIITPEDLRICQKITIQSETSAVYLISNSSGGYD